MAHNRGPDENMRSDPASIGTRGRAKVMPPNKWAIKQFHLCEFCLAVRFIAMAQFQRSAIKSGLGMVRRDKVI